MVEIHQSRASSLVNASSALCAIGQGNTSVNVIAEISGQLQKERQKNAELMEKISILESQLQKRDIKQPLPTDIGAGSCPTAEDRCFKKCKRQDIETTNGNGIESENIMKSTKMASEKKQDVQCLTQKDSILDSQLVNWMSMDETHFLQFEKTRDGDSTPDFDHDTDVSDDEADDYHQAEAIENSKALTLLKGNNDEICVEGSFVFQSEACFTNNRHKELVGHKPVCNTQMEQLRNQNIKVVENITDSFKTPLALSGSFAHYKKPPKVAFCPKEVKRIMESEALQLKNAQSHTIRKIIVFSSLGIRHGCEDMYELDFNHFSISRKGESYVSPTNPGEHVLYENPGVRRKVFYPNLQNPTLCPVQIIEEEKAMRPSDASCPSCLFLCIKYGGRTRNLPQNEYVRQRMGRNKLKSFGPLMCRMTMLVHIRSGSFFFKALGITLLFMAGYPDDLVQRETKHRNLDLLQKYYRTDEEAEGEELFLQQPLTCDIILSNQASPSSQQLTGKTNSTKSKGKKQTNTNNKAHKMQRFSLQQSSTLNSPSPTQFGLMGYTSIHSHAMAAFQSVPSQSHKPAGNPPTSSSVAPYHMLPPQPANGFVPMMYWPPPNTYPPPGPYAPSFGYQSFLSTGNYITVHHPPPYFSHPYCNPIIPKSTDRAGKSEMNAGLEEVDSDYVTGSSSTETKKI